MVLFHLFTYLLILSCKGKSQRLNRTFAWENGVRPTVGRTDQAADYGSIVFHSSQRCQHNTEIPRIYSNHKEKEINPKLR